MRSDARLNRERILDAATEILSSSPDASLKSIARKAGVGQGTLYRHFPTRESLVLEVYWNETERLALAASDLLRVFPPLPALREWLRRLAHFGRSTPGAADVLNSLATRPAERGDERYGRLADALSQLLCANEAAGTIRPGTTVDDLFLMLRFLWQIDFGSDGCARAERLLGIVLRGLSSTTADVPATLSVSDETWLTPSR